MLFGRMNGGAYEKVRVDDDLKKENRDKQQAMLIKRHDMLQKKQAEAVVVRNHNMAPVMVAKIVGVWKVVAAKPPGGKWEPSKALSYAWDMNKIAKGAEQPGGGRAKGKGAEGQ